MKTCGISGLVCATVSELMAGKFFLFFPSLIEVTTVETNYWIQFQFLTKCETCSACDYCSGF